MALLMKILRKIFIFIFLLSLIASVNKSKLKFIGVSQCKKCHESDAIGNQYNKWLKSPHSKAYKILKSNNALKIAKKHNIDNPLTSPVCLRCHTTGLGKNKKILEDGVGCESCHGPGNLYHSYSGHVYIGNREYAYKKAISLGMYPILGTDGIKAREKVCRFCHNKKRPCYPEDMKQQQQKYLPLQLIADFAFPHPLR